MMFLLAQSSSSWLTEIFSICSNIRSKQNEILSKHNLHSNCNIDTRVIWLTQQWSQSTNRVRVRFRVMQQNHESPLDYQMEPIEKKKIRDNC